MPSRNRIVYLRILSMQALSGLQVIRILLRSKKLADACNLVLD
jgi:hypothetical protein